MRILLLLLMFLCCSPAFAQFFYYAQRIVPQGALPATCNPNNGDVVMLTAAGTMGLYRCSATTNTWTPVGPTGTGMGQYNLAQGTLTASAPAINTTATWNAGAVTFVHNFMNITDTASAAASLLADWQVGGATQFSVSKVGNVSSTGSHIAGAGARFTLSGRSGFWSAADGRIHFTNQAATDFTRLTLGPEDAAHTTLFTQGVAGAAQGIRIATGDGTDCVFAELGAADNGHMIYCADCTKATPCAGAGTGALAVRLNGAWDCNP